MQDDQDYFKLCKVNISVSYIIKAIAMLAGLAIAAKGKPFPTAADFAKAVREVVPKNTSNPANSNTSEEKSKTQLCQSVKVSSQLHPRYGESGVISADAPNTSQQIVTFSDGEKLLVNNADLTDENDAIVSFSSERIYPKEYAEVIADLKVQHRRELERLEQELNPDFSQAIKNVLHEVM